MCVCKKNAGLFLVVLLLSCTKSATAPQKEERDLVEGNVVYESGVPASGADLTATPLGAIGKKTVKTDSDGRYQIQGLGNNLHFNLSGTDSKGNMFIMESLFVDSTSRMEPPNAVLKKAGTLKGVMELDVNNPYARNWGLAKIPFSPFSVRVDSFGIFEIKVPECTSLLEIIPDLKGWFNKRLPFSIKAGNTVNLDTVYLLKKTGPFVSARPEITVSVNDTIYLKNFIPEYFSDFVKFEWGIPDTQTFVKVESGDTFTVAPTEPDSNYRYFLRVTDADSHVFTDYLEVDIIRDPPLVNAGKSETVLIGDTIRLRGTGFDSFGTIEKWEWEIGGTFYQTSGPDTTILAPSQKALPFSVVLRATDDDGIFSEDTVDFYVYNSAGFQADSHTVALWKFNKGPADSVYDVSGNGNHGVAHGSPNRAKGKLDSAMIFDGLDDFVRIAPSSTLEYAGTGGWTIETWIRTPESPATQAHSTIIGQGSDSGSSLYPYRFEVYDKKVSYAIQSIDGSSGFSPDNRCGGMTDSSSCNYDSWSYVAGVYDGEGITVYVNGKVAGKSNTKTPMAVKKNPVFIGGFEDSLGTGKDFFKGEIEEIRISRVVRDSSEIALEMERWSGFQR